MTTPHIILLHGLWMRGFTLLTLKHRLEKAQFTAEVFDYSTVLHLPDVSIENLRNRLRNAEAEQVHLVGHSLGGLIALNATHSCQGLPPGRIVCLGSPLKGSSVARVLTHWPGGKSILGKSVDILCEGLSHWKGDREVGSIAGRLPIGFGFLAGTLTTPHDGTVEVAETELPGLTDHCIVPATHTSLLFSEEAANQTITFLQSGRFTHNS